MKKAISVLLQFVLFTVAFLAGSFHRPPFYQKTVELTPDVMRIFVYDGLLLMLALYVLILVIELLIRQFPRTAPWSTLAVLLAGIVGYALKFGFITHDLH